MSAAPQPTAGAVSGAACADDASRETSALQRAILECADYAIISTTPDGVIRTFNRAAERMLGYAAQEVIGKATPEILHDREEVAQRAAALTAELGRPVPAGFETFVAKSRLGLADEQDWTYLHKDGSRLPVQLSVTAMRDEAGQIIGFLGIAHNIMRRHEAQARVRQLTENLEQRVRERSAQLEASQQRYETLATTAPVGIYHCEPDGRCTFVNQRWCDLTGLKLAAALGEGWGNALHPDDRQRVVEEWARAVQEQRPFQLEYRYRTPAGATVWVYGQAVAERDLDGRVVSYVGTVTDITERKRAEQVTATFAELGRQLSAADTRRAAAGIIMIAADRLLPFDAALLHLLSPDRRRVFRILTVDTVNGWRAEQPGDDEVSAPSLMFRRVLKQGAQLIFQDEPEDAAIPFEPFGDARRQSASLMFVPLRAGENALGVLSLQSYTPRAYTRADLALLQSLADHAAGAFERLETEETLHESEQRFRGTFEQAAVGVAHVGLDGRWLRVNDWLCNLVGYTREELMTRTFQDITHPDDLEPDLAQARRLLAGEIPHYGMDKRYFHKDGSLVWIRLTGSLVRSADGSPQYFIAIVQDIRARKAAEESLRQAHDLLEERVRARTAELARLNMVLHSEVEERKATEAELHNREEQLRDLFENATDLIQSVAPDGRILFVNRAWLTTLGYRMGELAALSVFDIIHPECLGECREQFARVMQGEPLVNFQAVFRARDGRKIHVEGSANARFENGRPVATRAIFRDITARKAVEEERERLIAELQAALAEVKTLSGLLPVCGWCKKIRDDSGYWNSVEGYLKKSSGLDITHGICPDCSAKMMAELSKIAEEAAAQPPPSN